MLELHKNFEFSALSIAKIGDKKPDITMHFFWPLLRNFSLFIGEKVFIINGLSRMELLWRPDIYLLKAGISGCTCTTFINNSKTHSLGVVQFFRMIP